MSILLFEIENCIYLDSFSMFSSINGILLFHVIHGYSITTIKTSNVNRAIFMQFLVSQ